MSGKTVENINYKLIFKETREFENRDDIKIQNLEYDFSINQKNGELFFL